MDELDDRSGVPEGSWPAARYLRFGEFAIDLRYAILLRNGDKVELPDKAFQVLLHLVHRAGCAVPRGELRDIWPADEKSFVNRLSAAVSEIRGALGNEAKFVKTLSGCGYGFIGQVERSQSDTPKSN